MLNSYLVSYEGNLQERESLRSEDVHRWAEKELGYNPADKRSSVVLDAVVKDEPARTIKSVIMTYVSVSVGLTFGAYLMTRSGVDVLGALSMVNDVDGTNHDSIATEVFEIYSVTVPHQLGLTVLLAPLMRPHM